MATGASARRLLTVLLTVVLGGCTGDPVSTPGMTPDSGTPTTTPTVASTPEPPPPSPDDVDRILAFAAGTTDPGTSDLGKLWAQVFDQLQIEGQAPYQAPMRVLSYSAGELPETACAAGTTGRRWRNNARYCPADHVIAYDEDWFRAVGTEFSYFAPVAVLAHEWGHHVQSIAGLGDFDIQLELQADCFSGLYATASGLLPHEGDREAELVAMEQALRNWFTLGDKRYSESEWFDAGVHGSPQQRMMAFTTGADSNIDYPNPKPSMTGGFPWCYGYRDFKAGDFTKVGPYRLLNPPGRRGTRVGDAFVLAPETRTTRETSAIALAWIPDLPLDGGATKAQLQALWADRYPGLTPIAGVPIEDAITSGTGLAWYYESPTAIVDGANHVESGIFGLLAPTDASGGLLVLIHRAAAAPRDAKTPENLDILEDEISTFYQVVNRLCTPDESGDPSASNLHVACMTGVQ
jgi:predicted metalloprotease